MTPPVDAASDDFHLVENTGDQDELLVFMGQPAETPQSAACVKPAASYAVTRYFTSTYSWMVNHIFGPKRVKQVLGWDLEERHPFKKEIELLLDWPSYPLSTSVGTAYCQWLNDQFKDKGRVVSETLHNQEFIEGRSPLDHLKRILCEDGRPIPIYIPFVFPSHVVVIGIDFDLCQVHYYDSLAVSSIDRTPYPGFTIREELERIKNYCFGENEEAKILENTFPHQQDAHSCGVFSLNFIKRRLQGESFEKIIEGMEDVYRMRDQMGRELAGQNCASSVDPLSAVVETAPSPKIVVT